MSAERLQKVLASAGVASRRVCEELIASGRVSVNGRVMHELGARVDPAVDVIEVDGKPIQQPNERTYILLHKPVGVVSTAEDPQERPTVVELVNHEARLFPVGRLDTDSEGLILLTDDGELTHKLTHPSFEVEKEYRALLNEAPSAEALRQWREGVMLDNERTAPAWVDVQEPGEGGVWVRVVLREGRKRQIREVARLLGYEVLRLIRVREDTLELGDLPAGEWRSLTPEEVTTLQAHTVAVARTTPRVARSSRRSEAGDGEQDVVRPERGERSSRPRAATERADSGVRDERSGSRERRDESSYRERRDERSPREYGSRRDDRGGSGSRDDRGGSGSRDDRGGGYRGERSGRDFGGNTRRDDRGGSSYRDDRGSNSRGGSSGRDFGGSARRDDRSGGSSYRDDRGGGYRGERSGRDFGGNTRRDDRSGGSSYRDDRSGGYRGERSGRDFGGNTRRDDRSGGSSYRDDRGSNSRGGSYRDDRSGGYRGERRDEGNARGGRDFGGAPRRDEGNARGGRDFGGTPRRDDRSGGYRGERSGRDFGGAPRRDDRSGGYRGERSGRDFGGAPRRDDRSGGYRGERSGRDFGGAPRRDDRGGGYRDDRGGGFRERRDDNSFRERRDDRRSAPQQRDADAPREQSWQPPAEATRPTSRSESNQGGDQERRSRVTGGGARVARGTFRSRIAGRPAFPMRSRPSQSEGDDEE